jgi:predicted small lipoprotein YifL
MPRLAVALVMAALTLAACDRGKPRHLPPDPFAAPPPEAQGETPSAGLSAGLAKRPGLPGFFIDHIGAAADPMNKPPAPITTGAPMLLDGFGFDAAAKLPAKGVDVVIDGRVFGTRYGGDRSDVATYFKTPALGKTGFRTVLPPGTVAAGAHTAWLRVVTADGQGFNESPKVPFIVR